MKENSPYKSLQDWRKADPYAYKSALKKKAIPSICKIFNWVYTPYSPKKYTFSYLLESAKSFNSYVEWRFSYPKHYYKALENDDINKICKILGWEKYNKKKQVRRKRGRGNGHWNEERCIESAKPFTSRNEWVAAEPGASTAARKNGWYDKCTAHMPNRQKYKQYHWDNKKKVLKSALKYNTISEWASNYPSAYVSAKRNGWFDEATAHMLIKLKDKPRRTKEECIEVMGKCSSLAEFRTKYSKFYSFAIKHSWYPEEREKLIKRTEVNIHSHTKDECIEAASKCKNLSVFKNEYKDIFNTAKYMGWIEECKLVMYMYKSWSFEECLEDRKAYKSLREWASKRNLSYSFAKRKGWIDKIRELTGTNREKWVSEEICLKSALECENYTEWNKKYATAVRVAKKNNWLDNILKITKFTIGKTNTDVVEHTKSECMATALKCKRRGEWRKRFRTHYNCAHRHDWYDECTKHMTRTHKAPKINSTFDECMKSALECTHRMEWKKRFPIEWTAAIKFGWYDKCTKHMIRTHRTPKINSTFDECMTSALKCKRRGEWEKRFPIQYKSAIKFGWYDKCTKHMTRTHKKND